MNITANDALAALYGDALDFAQTLEEDLSSFHFLLSFYTIPSEVTVLLEDLAVSERMVTDAFKELCRRAEKSGAPLKEPEGMIRDIETAALGFRQGAHDTLSPIHLFLAILGERRSIAYQALQEAGALSDLRLRAMNTLTNPPRRIAARILELLEEATPVHPMLVPTDGAAFPEKEPSMYPAPPATDAAESQETPEASDALPEAFRLFGRDLTALATEGELEPVFGRDREIELMLDILGRKKSNNPLLVGPAGAGKTAIVEGLACRQREGALAGRIIWELNLSSLVAGTEYRGALEKRMIELIDEVERRKERLIVFIDEIHLLGSETHEMVANLLKPALARGGFPLIGATTPDEFRRFIARDAAMERRFTLVPVEEPEGEALITIAHAAARSLSAYHRVRLDDPRFIATAVDLSNRYISGRSQPDKVLSLLDTLGSVLQRAGKERAAENDLVALISARSGIPPENLLVDGARILQTLPDRLDAAIKGQREAKERLVRLLSRRFVRKDPRRPIASMIFAGPSGVGKTETARRLAEYFFGSTRRMVAFDMSEFMEPHTVSRLIGSPPGYTGYEEGGRLTEQFRREPYQLLVLDEVEKAHPKVLSLLLQLLEEGRLTDSRGFTVSFAQAMVIMTTNLGGEETHAPRLGFESGRSTDTPQVERQTRLRLEKALSPELINRVDDIVPFLPFTEEEFREVAAHLLDAALAEYDEHYGLQVSLHDRSAFLAGMVAAIPAVERSQGARAIHRWIERHLECAVLDRSVDRGAVGPLTLRFDRLTGSLVIDPFSRSGEESSSSS